VTSEQLLELVRCPDCRARLRQVTPSSPADAAGRVLTCEGCGRAYPAPAVGFLDLRPLEQFSETTKYVDEALHADSRHETVSPPLLSAAIRNDMLRAMLQLTPADRVVDLGCGSGRALVWNEDLGAYRVGSAVGRGPAHRRPPETAGGRRRVHEGVLA